MANYLLKEDGDKLLQEDGNKILIDLASAATPPPGWLGFMRYAIANIGRRHRIGFVTQARRR